MSDEKVYPDRLNIDAIIEHIRTAKAMVLATIDQNDMLVVSSRGIEDDKVPAALRHFADTVEQQAGYTSVEACSGADSEYEATPPNRKSQCPQCDMRVLLSEDLPPNAFDSTIHPACVCRCGAFLVPSLDATGALQLRMMEMEEIANLPDKVRNTMVRIRKRMPGRRTN